MLHLPQIADDLLLFNVVSLAKPCEAVVVIVRPFIFSTLIIILESVQHFEKVCPSSDLHLKTVLSVYFGLLSKIASGQTIWSDPNIILFPKPA